MCRSATALGFYLEPEEPRGIIAVDRSSFSIGRDGDFVYDGVGGIYPREDSPVGDVRVSLAFLSDCERVSEEEARRIHPRLFAFLEAAMKPKMDHAVLEVAR